MYKTYLHWYQNVQCIHQWCKYKSGNANTIINNHSILCNVHQAKEKGMTAVEFDVALTKDHVPIVFHDSTVDRITEATGRIDSMTWEELKQLDISEKHPMRYCYFPLYRLVSFVCYQTVYTKVSCFYCYRHKFRGERIPLFEDVVKECLDLGLRMFIDLKGYDLKVCLCSFPAIICYNFLLTHKVSSHHPAK